LNAGAAGLLAQSQRLAVTADNVANISTTGFKRARVNFADLFSTVVQPPGANGDGSLGIAFGQGVAVAAIQNDFGQGRLISTGRTLDVAIQGLGFFAVSDPAGNTVFSRAGNLTLNADGELTLNGLPIQPGIAIPADATEVAIAPDGTVAATRSGARAPEVVGQLEAVRFVNPEGLVQLGENLLASSAASGEPVVGVFGSDGFGVVQQGFLEGSNVEPVAELVDLIVNQQAFVLNARVVEAADERLRLLSELRG
jgi:flagellar basal-body rod protein FlgG